MCFPPSLFMHKAQNWAVLLPVHPSCQGKGNDGAGLLGLCSKLPPAAGNILNVRVFL